MWRAHKIQVGSLALAVALLVPFLGSSAQSAVGQGRPVRGGNLTVTGPTIPPLFDPGAPTAQITTQSLIYPAVYDSLFREGPRGAIVPDLALKLTISRNHKIVAIYLRHGVKFQDGSAFNAKAVAWNILRDANPNTGCTCSVFLTFVSSVTAPTPDKVVVYLSQPDAPIVSLFESSSPAFIISPSAFQTEGASQFGAHPVGAGPFKMTTDNPGTSVVLTKFPQYWDTSHVYLNSVTYNFAPVTASAYATLESGASQLMIGPDIPTLGQSHSNPSVKILTLPATTSSELRFNISHPPFNNPLARAAVFYATDPAPILHSLYSGLNYAEQQPIPPGMAYYPGPKLPGEKFDSYNLAKAQALVKQLGGLSFVLTPFGNSAAVVALVEALQKEYEAAGMSVTLNVVTTVNAIADVENGSWTLVSDTFGIYLDPSLAVANYYSTTAALNHGIYDSHLQGLLVKSETTVNPSQRQAAIYALINYMVVKQHYLYPLSEGATHDLASTSLEGIPATPIIYVANAWLK